MFTRDQIAVLQAAFDHVWGRMARMQEDLNEESTRLLTDSLAAGYQVFHPAAEQVSSMTGQ